MNGTRAAQFILLAGIILLKTSAKDIVRLVEGPTAREGRVEVYNSDAWGVVCGELWDKVDANVVCRMLGYGGAVAYQQNITFEQKNDTVWLSRVQCIGNESSLSQCAHAGWGKHTCNSSQAAGVTCLGRDRNISSVAPQFISSTLDTITISCNMPGVTLMTYAVQIWSRTTKKWLDTKCRHGNVNGSCVVRNPCANITVEGLIPGHAYYFRFVSPSFESSQGSHEMVTKKLGYPTAPRFVSRTNSSITLIWESAASESTNFSVEMRCCQQKTWTEAHCKENLFGKGCTVSRTTATVTGLKQNKVYYFRVYAVYKSWKSATSAASEAMRTQSGKADFPKGKIWIASLASQCVTSQIGDTITLFCHVPGDKLNFYKWTKGDRTIFNGSGDGVLNVSISSVSDFGVYTCHAINSEGHAIYNISICQKTALVETVTQDPMNNIVIAIITTSFICFGIFIIVLILIKMAQIYRRRKKQSKDKSSGREEVAMLHYRQKSVRSGNNNEEDLD
ncbi:hypothetical protein ACROYT_G042731 [Oculina patagonica]